MFPVEGDNSNAKIFQALAGAGVGVFVITPPLQPHFAIPEEMQGGGDCMVPSSIGSDRDRALPSRGLDTGPSVQPGFFLNLRGGESH